jgi:hypothetical protein
VAGTVNTTDPDSGDSFAYALVTGDGDTDNDAFTVSSNTLRTVVMFDFEGRSTYSFRVRSMDRGGLSVEKAFAITVTDTNEAPSDITLSDSSVLKDQPANAVVGAFSTADPDRGNTCTYSSATGEGGSGNDCFTVSSSSLHTVAPFNFEGKSGYDIRVRSTDQEGLWFEKTFTITVADANEAPATPTNFLPTDAAVNEPPTVTFQTSAFSDPDSGDAHAASQWLIRRVAGSALVFDSDHDTPHLTSLSLAAGLLDYGATYDWQVRYKDAHGTWSGYSTATTFSTLAPTLTVTSDGYDILLSWLTNTRGFALEYALCLPTHDWTSALPPPVVAAGRNVVSNTLDRARAFYRLNKP